jgi:hypothetical protein
MEVGVQPKSSKYRRVSLPGHHSTCKASPSSLCAEMAHKGEFLNSWLNLLQNSWRRTVREVCSPVTRRFFGGCRGPGWHFHQFSIALGMSAPPLSRLPRDGRPLDRDYVTTRRSRVRETTKGPSSVRRIFH